MSDGFPPFRPQAARPKGQAAPVRMAQDDNMEMTTAQARTYEEVQALIDRGEEQAPLDVRIQQITVCAKCGSRDVREAILVDGEVYVKL